MLANWHPKHQEYAEPVSLRGHRLLLLTAGEVGRAVVMGGSDKDLRSSNTVSLFGAIPLDVRM